MNKQEFKQYLKENRKELDGKSYTYGVAMYSAVIKDNYGLDETLKDNLIFEDGLSDKFDSTNLSDRAVMEIVDIAIIDEIVSEWLREEEE